MELHARSSPHSMFMQPKTINDKNFDAKHKTFSDTDNAQGLEQISVCVPFSSYRYTFSMFIEGLWQGKICTHADDGGCCAPNVRFTGQVCGDQGDVAKTCALCSKAALSTFYLTKLDCIMPRVCVWSVYIYNIHNSIRRQVYETHR